jgi:Fe2+ transport system protein FeoA
MFRQEFQGSEFESSDFWDMFEMQEEGITETARALDVKQISLSELMPGEKGTVERISHAVATVRQRLMEMGVVTGIQVQLIRFAPLGDPIEVRVGGYRLSLRRNEARAVLVTKEVT